MRRRPMPDLPVRLTSPASPAEQRWRALRFFNLYRLVISGLFVLLILLDGTPPPLGSAEPLSYKIFAYAYLAAAVALQGVCEARWFRTTAFTVTQVIVDVIFISGLMLASGGLDSGLGILLLATLAASGLVSTRRQTLFYAALTTITLMLAEIYASTTQYQTINYTQAGLLGMAYFVVAVVTQALGRRVLESEALAEVRAQAMKSLEELNAQVVQRLQSGVMVLDAAGEVRLSNAAAERLLNATAKQEVLAAVHNKPAGAAVTLRLKNSGTEITVTRSDLPASGSAERGEALLFIEDAAETRQLAQQMKLVSLGRLTANIAHEVRNPLGAISHAAQLLQESLPADGESQQLSRIIHDHTQRLNRLIEDVMGLSRRGEAVPSQIELLDWLQKFLAELCLRHQLSANSIGLSVSPATLQVLFDGNQLHQVMWNLCENALRYTRVDGERLSITAGVQPISQRAYLEVRDYGMGLPQNLAEHIFEPFFTTEASGTGLGLYIAAELCAINQATISLSQYGAEGCTFRIVFCPR